MRYIHLNPIRVGIIKTLEELDHYPWSGHRSIIGEAKHSWMGAHHVLSQFGGTRRKAIKAYRQFLHEGFQIGHLPELSGGGLTRSQGGWSQVLAMRRRGREEGFDERILGKGDFVNKVLKEAEDRQLRQLKYRRRDGSIENIIGEECRRREVSPEEIMAGNRRWKVSDTRAVIAHRSREELGLNAAEIARHLGVNTLSITGAIDRAEKRNPYKKHR